MISTLTRPVRDIILCLSAVMFATGTAMAGEQSYVTEVINNINIGDISISLTELELTETGEEIPYRNGKCVLPGDTLSKIVRITNNANPAWVRAKLSFTADDTRLEFPSYCIALADELWIERGGCYYYTVPLQTGEETDLCREVRIPEFWDEEAAGKNFAVTITVEAVQQANFMPDFAADDPWFGTLIETCLHTAYDQYGLMTLRYESFSVSFEGGAEGLVRIGDDFFAGFGTLMPGDTGTGTVSLRNSYSEPIDLLFRTEGNQDEVLANEARLTILDDDRVIFDGRLSESKEEVQIAQLQKGEEKNLVYSIFIPPECGNSYAVTNAADKWVFRACLNVEEDRGGGTASGGRHSGSGGGAVAESVPVEDKPSPAARFFPAIGRLSQTGEGRGMITALFMMTVSGVVVVTAVKRGSLKKRMSKRKGGTS